MAQPTSQPDKTKIESSLLRLNLGCGQNLMAGFLNVDKFGEPELRFDLETFPWPWEDNSVEIVNLSHVLEHLGESTDTYFKIIQELYRICRHNASIYINVPHPRHDDFLSDPSHVRVVTPDGLNLFSKRLNHEWGQQGAANSPLALYLDVDFEVINTNYVLDEPWLTRYKNGELTETEARQAILFYNNVVKQLEIELKVIKD